MNGPNLLHISWFVFFNALCSFPSRLKSNKNPDQDTKQKYNPVRSWTDNSYSVKKIVFCARLIMNILDY